MFACSTDPKSALTRDQGVDEAISESAFTCEWRKVAQNGLSSSHTRGEQASVAEFQQRVKFKIRNSQEENSGDLKKRLDQVNAEKDSLARSNSALLLQLAQIVELNETDRRTRAWLYLFLENSENNCKEMRSQYNSQICQLNKTIAAQKQLIQGLLDKVERQQNIHESVKEKEALADLIKRQASEFKERDEQTKAELTAMREMLNELVERSRNSKKKRVQCFDAEGGGETEMRTSEQTETATKRPKTELSVTDNAPTEPLVKSEPQVVEVETHMLVETTESSQLPKPRRKTRRED